MSDQTPRSHGESQKDDSGMSPGTAAKGGWLYKAAIGVLAVLCVVVYVKKRIDVGDLETQIQNERAQCTKQAASGLSEQAEELLRLDMVALTRALEPVMQRGDVAGLQQFIETMVKERYVSSISVADESGTIVAATNKKWEGASLEGVFPGSLGQGKQVTVRQDGETFQALGPTTHEGQRTGTVVLVYSTATVKERMPEPGKP